MATVWYVGDACIPIKQPDHPVMFVYDLGSPDKRTEWVMCNWLDRGQMIRRAFHVDDLKRSRRELARR